MGAFHYHEEVSERNAVLVLILLVGELLILLFYPDRFISWQ